MSDEQQDLKPKGDGEETPAEDGQAEKKPEGEEKPKPTYEELEAQNTKLESDNSNYKKERAKHANNRSIDEGNEPKKPEGEAAAEPKPATISEADQSFVVNSVTKSLKDLHDVDEFKTKVEALPEDQYQTFYDVIAASKKTLIEKALATGQIVGEVEVDRALKTAFAIATGGQSGGGAEAKARAQGQADILNAKKADMGNVRTIPKGESGTTEDDKQVEHETGGLVSAERAKEIREARAARAADYAPQHRI